MIIVDPLAIAATPLVGGAAGAGSGAANLLTPSPREIWAAGAVGASTIDIDLGAEAAVDSFFLGFTNATTAASWSIDKGTGLGAGLTEIMASAAFRAADSIGPRHHGFARLGEPVTARYFRLNITQTGAAALQVGTLLVGLAFQAPYELGSGRTPIDMSTIDALQDGGFGIGAGAIKAALKWTFVGLTPTERRDLWRRVIGRGQSRPVLVVEELDEDGGANEELHYGLFDKFEAYEREDPAETRWALSMTEWV